MDVRLLFTISAMITDLLDMREPSTMSESSMREMISWVSSPLSSSSPRVLNGAKAKFCTAQSALTCFSLASISLSFTALMQISYSVDDKCSWFMNA